MEVEVYLDTHSYYLIWNVKAMLSHWWLILLWSWHWDLNVLDNRLPLNSFEGKKRGKNRCDTLWSQTQLLKDYFLECRNVLRIIWTFTPSVSASSVLQKLLLPESADLFSALLWGSLASLYTQSTYWCIFIYTTWMYAHSDVETINFSSCISATQEWSFTFCFLKEDQIALMASLHFSLELKYLPLKHTGIKKSWLLIWSHLQKTTEALTKYRKQNNGNDSEDSVQEAKSRQWKHSQWLEVRIHSYAITLILYFICLGLCPSFLTAPASISEATSTHKSKNCRMNALHKSYRNMGSGKRSTTEPGRHLQHETLYQEHENQQA